MARAGRAGLPEGRLTGDAERVKAAANVAAIIGQYVKLRRRGKDLVGLCPFHVEKTPSFTVTPAKGRWHCFGCGAGGDVLTFIRRIERVNFPRALAIVAWPAYPCMERPLSNGATMPRARQTASCSTTSA